MLLASNSLFFKTKSEFILLIFITIYKIVTKNAEKYGFSEIDFLKNP